MNFELLWWLLVGHALADFPIQGDTMAKYKNRNTDRAPAMPVWWIWLTGHSLIAGGAVSLATGVWWLGVCEAAAHWVIDFSKCEGWFGATFDQFLHVACKVVWWLLVIFSL